LSSRASGLDVGDVDGVGLAGVAVVLDPFAVPGFTECVARAPTGLVTVPVCWQ
jgi:hypothetical protein